MKRVLVFICMSLFLVGCAENSSVSSEPELEPYYKNEAKAESRYETLELVKLQDEDIKIETYLPSDETLVKNEMDATSSKNGVSVSIQLKHEEQPGKIMQEMYEKEKSRITSLANMKNFKAFDLIEGEKYWMLEMNYQIEKDELLYPCLSILKLDDLEDGFYLASLIQIDNTKANEETTKVVEEMMEVYGINIAK